MKVWRQEELLNRTRSWEMNVNKLQDPASNLVGPSNIRTVQWEAGYRRTMKLGLDEDHTHLGRRGQPRKETGYKNCETQSTREPILESE